MRFDFAVIALSLLTNAAATAIGDRNAIKYDGVALAEDHELYKRRGGGGGGGRGGGGGGSRGGSSSSSGSSGSSGSSSKGGGSGSSRPANTQPNSISGGTSRGGSGPPPRFPGGRYTGGGRTPYRSGGISPVTGLAAGALLAGSALLFWPHFAGYNVWPYHYHDDYKFHNETANKNESLPIICGCRENYECACEDDGDNEHLKEMIGNGSYAGLNKSSIDIGYPNGTKTILIDGTLPPGTTANSGAMRQAVNALGFWPVAAVVFAIVFAA